MKNKLEETDEIRKITYKNESCEDNEMYDIPLNHEPKFGISNDNLVKLMNFCIDVYQVMKEKQ